MAGKDVFRSSGTFVPEAFPLLKIEGRVVVQLKDILNGYALQALRTREAKAFLSLLMDAVFRIQGHGFRKSSSIVKPFDGNSVGYERANHAIGVVVPKKIRKIPIGDPSLEGFCI